MKSQPYAYPSPLPSTSGTTIPPVNTARNSNFKAPDSKVAKKNQNYLLFEVPKRATIAEREAGEHLKEKQSLERQVKDLDAQAKNPLAAYKHLTAENETLKESLANLQNHTKACEKAIDKAQEDAQNAKAYADHIINSLKGQLRCAEKRCDNVARELKVWKQRYGDVEYPAEQIAALQMILLKWQSQGEKMCGEIAGLEGERRGEGTQTRVKLEDEDPSSSVSPEEENPFAVKTERTLNSGTSEAGRIALAEAEVKAALYKVERDTLRRILQEQVVSNSKMAESLVLRNAKLAEALEGELGR